MTDNSIYFGLPGSLTTITWPKGGLANPRTRATSTFTLGSGGQQVWKTLNGKRSYTLNYGALDLATFTQLQAYDQGHMGPGPFVLLDPGQRNQLTANQSSATSLMNSADNFTVAGTGGVLSSSSALVRRGPRSLLWTLSVGNPATATVSLDPPTTDWPGTPVASRQYSFGFWAQTQVDASVTLRAVLTWLDAAGNTLSAATGSPTAATTSGWTQITVTGTPPASTAFVNASISASGSTISAGAKVFMDQFQLNEGASVDTSWTPGTGVFPVIPISLSEQQQWMFPDYRVGPVLLLAEVGI